MIIVFVLNVTKCTAYDARKEYTKPFIMIVDLNNTTDRINILCHQINNKKKRKIKWIPIIKISKRNIIIKLF
jgi:hypothetical protein